MSHQQIIVSRRIERAKFQWIDRDIEEGEVWWGFIDWYRICGPNTICASQNKVTGTPFCALPLSHVYLV